MDQIETRFKSLNDQINEIIIKQTKSTHDLLNSAISDLVRAGGKRLRPTMTLLAGKFGDYQDNKIINIAAGLELLHMATLVHDDIIDEAKLRRGEITAQQRFGKDIAVFVGDYLLSKSYILFSEYLQRKSLQKLNKIVRLICVGEIGQYQQKYNYNITLKDYFKRIRRKTALLFGVSTYLGAYESGLRGSHLYNLYKFGIELGMTFQIQDDVLDFSGSEKTIGKDSDQDIVAGVYTLPIIFLLKDKKYYNEARQILDKENNLTDNDIQKINNMVIDGGYLDQSREMGRRFLDRAAEHLNCLPDNKSKEDFQYILDTQLTRKL